MKRVKKRGGRPVLGSLLILLFLSVKATAGAELMVAGKSVQLVLTPISLHTLRITLNPTGIAGRVISLNDSLVLVHRDWPEPAIRVTQVEDVRSLQLPGFTVTLRPSPLTIEVRTAEGDFVQRISIDGKTGAVTFAAADHPLFGLGGGGPGFDRRGTFDAMDNGHRAGEYQIYGSRVPVPFLISTAGWALFFHRPYNAAFDLRGEQGKFLPRAVPRNAKEEAVPLDFFLIRCPSPPVALSEYILLTGRSVLPPRWALGYIQSHRTLAGPDEILNTAETFRRKGLPCDVLIYLGTGYCPAGWNMGHGSLTFNPKTFDRPQEIIDRLHELHFKVILHKNRAPVTLHGSFSDKEPEAANADHIIQYWKRHRPLFRLGVDGWWPDDGDNLPVDSRLVRHFMYYEGSLGEQPDTRPFSLHRTGYAGMQRYGGWVWSGDVFSLWDTLAAHVSVGINFSMSASPYWGTDIGGFFPTRELTGELYVRWFQFACFTPIFRSHGRLWHLRRPWGWNTGELGPYEVVEGQRGTAAPDPKELRNPEVEPICRQYLLLRYRLLPYTYTLARMAYDSGMPLMRALWLHYPDDTEAVGAGDQFLWGRDILVAPVTEKGATTRNVYLPGGTWYDYWTNRRLEGQQRITRYVDLSTMPLYIRAGAILPIGPALQYTEQTHEEQMEVRVYTGADGGFILYEDDGRSLGYREDRILLTQFTWDDEERCLVIQPVVRPGLLSPEPRTFEILLLPEKTTRRVTYRGSRMEVAFNPF